MNAHLNNPIGLLTDLHLFFPRVAEHSNFNKMSVRNLAVVFGPTLMRSRQDDVTQSSLQCSVIEILISFYDRIFKDHVI
jgi:hypothetical protein